MCHSGDHRFEERTCPLELKRPLTNVEAFKGRDSVFSNFYSCRVHVFERTFASSEHAYQYMKCVTAGNQRVADQVARSNDGPEAKRLAKEVPSTPEWQNCRVNTMREIIRAKLRGCPEYQQALRTSRDVIAEAVPFDRYWSAGMLPKSLVRTPMDKWPGENVMGKLHMELRKEVFKR